VEKGVGAVQTSEPQEEIMENPLGLPVFECRRCNHKWSPRKPETPLRCGSCKSPYWKTPPDSGRVSMGRRKRK